MISFNIVYAQNNNLLRFFPLVNLLFPIDIFIASKIISYS